MGVNKLLKGTLRTIVLRLLEKNDRMYGYQITQEVKSLSEGQFSITEGSLYPILYKLVEDGLVTSCSEIYDGRVRKYYSLSCEGKVEAVSKLQEAIIFVENFQKILTLDTSLQHENK